MYGLGSPTATVLPRIWLEKEYPFAVLHFHEVEIESVLHGCFRMVVAPKTTATCGSTSLRMAATARRRSASWRSDLLIFASEERMRRWRSGVLRRLGGSLTTRRSPRTSGRTLRTRPLRLSRARLRRFTIHLASPGWLHTVLQELGRRAWVTPAVNLTVSHLPSRRRPWWGGVVAICSGRWRVTSRKQW